MTVSNFPPLTAGQCATLACLLEVTAPKVGNVHRGADFADLTFADFVASGIAIAPAIDAAAEVGIGQTVLAAVRATRGVVSTNTNLGIVLLLAPLAAVPRNERLSPSAVHRVLKALTPADSQAVYEAIRLAQPGGLSQVDKMDVAGSAPDDLLAAMTAAAQRDLVAHQYVTDFRLVLEEALPLLVAGRESGWSMTDSIIRAHVQLIARHGDSLIARKCGPEISRQAQALAGRVLESGQPPDEAYHDALSDFDFWLRSDGHRRNPGTTADLIAAALFAGLRDGYLPPPWR
jgi:triphosphoribosyl-dephospho-CoA synthase